MVLHKVLVVFTALTIAATQLPYSSVQAEQAKDATNDAASDSRSDPELDATRRAAELAEAQARLLEAQARQDEAKQRMRQANEQ